MRDKPGSGYKVGYKKPPKHTQFKKGTSGNKAGRPKGSKNLATWFHKELNQRVPISENGRPRTISKMEAFIKQLVNRALSGDAKAMQTFISLAKEFGDLKMPDVSEPRRITLRIFENGKDVTPTDEGESI